MKRNDLLLSLVCMAGTFSAVTLSFPPLPAQAAEYVLYVNLVGCRSLPTADGRDVAVINPAASSVTVISTAVDRTTLVCDLPLPQNATQLSAVALEYSSRASDPAYEFRLPAAPLVLRVYLTAQERSIRFASEPTGRPRLLSQQIGGCTVPNPPPDTGLNVCTASLNQSLIPYSGTATDPRGFTQKVWRDSISTSATVTVPVGFGSEGGRGEYAKVHRLRVAYQAP